ncbi:MAG: hypothetical protein V4621_04285 [Pseudomonadota bacterium]
MTPIDVTLAKLENALNAPTLTQDDWQRMQVDTQALCTALQGLPADQAGPYAARVRTIISRLETVEMDLTDQINTLRQV